MKKFLFASPLQVMTAEIDQHRDEYDAVNSPAGVHLLKSELLSKDVYNQMEEIKSLQASLEMVTKKYDSAKEQLELFSEQLKAAQTEVATAKEECDSLRLKLQISEAVSAKSTVELDLFKSELLQKNIELESLKKEKKSLEENILFLSEEISAATSKIDQLKNDKTKIEECHAQQIEHLQQKIVVADGHCKDLNQKLEDCNKCLHEEITKIAELESKCINISNDKTKLEIENNELEEKLLRILEQSAENETEFNCQKLNKQLDDVNKVAQDRGSKINRLEEACKVLKSINSELSKNIEIENEKYSVLSEKHGMTDLKCQDLTKQLEAINTVANDQKTQIIQLEEECATLKNENTELSSDFNIEKEKWAALSKEHGAANSKIEYLQNKLNKEMNEGSKMIDDSKLNLSVAQEKCSELLFKLEEQNSIIAKLESDCCEYQIKNKELLERIKKLEEECAILTNKQETALKEKCSETDLHLETTLQQLEEQKLKNITLEEKCCDLSSQLDETVQDQLEKALKISSLEKKTEELNQELVNLNNVISELKLRVNTLELECSSHKSNHSELLEDYTSLEEKFSSMKEKLAKFEEICAQNKEEMDKYTEKITELEKSISEKKCRIQELQENVQALDNCKLELQNKEISIASSKEEIANLKSELEKSKLMVEQYAKFEEICSQNKESTKKYTEKITELEKSISERKCRIQELTETVQALDNCKLELQNKEISIASYKEELTDLKRELEKSKLMKEQSDLLCESVQKCEWLASNKIKLLESSSTEHLHKIADMKRQIKEKNDSISELEKALCDRQRQVKEMDINITKQVTARRQDAARIEQILHQKKLLETEIYKLKLDLQQAADKEASNKAQDVKKRSSDTKDEEKHLSNESKGRKKRSSSEANKEIDEKLENKENSKITNKVQEKKLSKTAKDAENTEEHKNLPKRRRVLRTQQAKAIDSFDDSFEIKEADDKEYEPIKKSNLRKKKTASKVTEPPKQRTSRRKLQEQENMSPVKKAMQFMGSKIRSAAQAVSNMPSPRVTRGRKKLFNADAAPKAELKWRP